jgi:hypothetical protein
MKRVTKADIKLWIKKNWGVGKILKNGDICRFRRFYDGTTEWYKVATVDSIKAILQKENKE